MLQKNSTTNIEKREIGKQRSISIQQLLVMKVWAFFEKRAEGKSGGERWQEE